MNLQGVLNWFGGGSEIKKANDRQLAPQQGGEVRNRPRITTGMGGTGGYGYGGSWWAELLGLGRVTDWSIEAGHVHENSIYSICTSFIAFETVKAALELQLYETEGDTWSEDPEHMAALILQNPHPYMALSGIIGALSVDLARGNAFCQVPKTAAGRPAELWWLPRENWRVWLETVDGQHYKRYQVTIPGGGIEHYWDITAPDIDGNGTNSVMHFRAPKPDPNNFLLGFDPIPPQYRHLCVDNEGGTYQHTVLKNMGISPWVIAWKDKDTVPDMAARNDLKRSIRSNNTGENRGAPTILDSEVDIHELTNNPEKMALDTILNRPEERIPAALRLNAMALQLGGATQRSTFNNVSEAKKSAWDNGIAPLHTIIADTLNHKLLPAFDTAPNGTRIAAGDGQKRRFFFSYENVPDLQEDENAMWERANKAFDGGGVEVNEKRAILRLKPLEDTDPRGKLMAHELKAPGAGADGAVPGDTQTQGAAGSSNKSIAIVGEGGETSTMKIEGNENTAPADDAGEMPAPLPDPFGVGLTQKEIDELTDTDSEAATTLAFALSSVDKREMLGADAVNNAHA